MPDSWNVLLVEDDETVRRQVKEFLEAETFAAQRMNVTDIPELPAALNLIKERKADLVILDVYRGSAAPGGEQTGVRILESIKRSGFVPVVLYTALPEGLEGLKSSFVRLVGKEAGSLDRLKTEITDLFRLRIPQLHRAVVDHFDQALCSYMWGFVQDRWAEFSPIIEKPEFIRLVVQRLALTFARVGIDSITAAVYGGVAPSGAPNPDDVHPAEYYIKPSIGDDPLLGDVRVRGAGEAQSYIVVLWPNCDMVSVGGRTPKTDQILCAKCIPAIECPEVSLWLADPSNTKKKKVEELIKNNRDKTPDRYHFLPGVWDIPDLIVDFQALEHLCLQDVKGLRCLATLASPFAEALGIRFGRYIGRVGTPDLHVESVLAQMTQRHGRGRGGQ